MESRTLPLETDSSTKPLSGSSVELTLCINGVEHTLAVDVRTTLLDALRDYLGLTGTAFRQLLRIRKCRARPRSPHKRCAKCARSHCEDPLNFSTSGMYSAAISSSRSTLVDATSNWH